MNTLTEKIAVWTFFLTVLAVVIGVTYATVHLVRDTATTTEMNARFDEIDAKIDTQFELIREELSAIRKDIHAIDVKVSDSMVNHLSTTHASKF